MEDELTVTTTTDATTISADNSNDGGDDVSTSSPPMVVLTNDEASASDDGAVASSTTTTTTTTRPITCPRQFFRLLLSTRFQGNESSLPMEMCSNFDAYELRRLARRFKKLDLDGSGSLSVDEFMSLPELQQNPLVQRVIDIFDEDGNGEVDFREFIQGISQFSVKGDKNIKLKFAFRIYDMDRDGFISNGELFQVLKMMVGNNLKDTQLQQIVDKTILFHDKDGDGKISFDEFCEVVEHTEVHKKMVLENI